MTKVLFDSLFTMGRVLALTSSLQLLYVLCTEKNRLKMRYFFLNFKHCERGGLRYPTIVLNEAEQQLPIFPTFSWKISIVGLHSWPVRRWWYNGPIAP
mgnify:CR=1 FL=1